MKKSAPIKKRFVAFVMMLGLFPATVFGNTGNSVLSRETIQTAVDAIEDMGFRIPKVNQMNIGLMTAYIQNEVDKVLAIVDKDTTAKVVYITDEDRFNVLLTRGTESGWLANIANIEYIPLSAFEKAMVAREAILDARYEIVAGDSPMNNALYLQDQVRSNIPTDRRMTAGTDVNVSASVTHLSSGAYQVVVTATGIGGIYFILPPTIIR